MHKSLKMLMAASALGVAALVGTAPLPVGSAAAQGFALSFDVGNVAFAYRDGYYDRHRRWHRWRSDRERYWYRRHHRHAYYDMRRDRDRYRDRRWSRYRDNDRDGVPNRFDRDRDNDGVPNRYDGRPNNPYRD